MSVLLLIHGGLPGEAMDAERFWYRPGIVPGLNGRGFTVLAPDRAPRAATWPAEVEHLMPALPSAPMTVMGGSNGCSVAVRLAVTLAGRVERLLLAWPATAGDPAVDGPIRDGLGEAGLAPAGIEALLAGPTLRGVGDRELTALTTPVGLLPSVPDNPAHQRRTVDALRRLLPRARVLPGCPEPPRPDFPPHLEFLLDAITAFART